MSVNCFGRCRVLGVLLVSVVALAATALGKPAPQHAVSYSWHWTYRKINVPANGAVRVSLPDLPSNAQYVAGFRVDNVSAPVFIVGEAIPGRQVSRQIWMVSGVENWPTENVKVAPGSIEITRVPNSGGWLIVYGELPTGTAVELRGPHGLIASGRVEGQGGLLVHDSAVVGKRVLGMRTLIATLTYSGAYGPGNTEPVLVREGQYFVTPAALAKHIITFVRPAYPPGLSPSHDGTMANLLLMIGPDGLVRDVRKVDGDTVALDVCASAMRSWRFSPFTVNGAPVAVRAPLRFVFAKDGSVASPILNAMAGR